MQLDSKNSSTHYWITAFWCALGAIVIGAIAIISCWMRKCRPKKRRALKPVRRTNSANEIDSSMITAANKRAIFSSHRSASSEQENGSDHSEHSEKSPLVSARLDSLAKLFFSRSMPETSSRNSVDSSLSRSNLKYQYSALDSGNGVQDRSPRERAARDRALSACQEWIFKSNGRYDIIAHLDEIGSRHNKNWFLVNDTSVRTDRLLTLLPIPPDCVALEELPPSESPKGLLMELLGSLHHPYIYPILDLGFLHNDSINYACLVTPFNPRGSLKDLIYHAQWNEPWNRKYTRKPTCLPVTQIQRLGRQILEALLFLKERGFPLHGHLHSGNVILQNGVARLSGLENGLLGINSRVSAVVWSRSATDIENIDIICFGHLLYEMCVGYELNCAQPSVAILEMDLERYPQILEIVLMIFDAPGGCYPTVEDLVLCDIFRNIDLRELRGPCVSTIKPSLSKSTLNLLQAVKRRQTASLGGSFSEASSPCSPPSTPRDRRMGTTDSFDISSDSESVLDEVVITSNSYDSHHYDTLNSPIHFCDNSIQSDDNSSIITAPSASATSRAYEEAEFNISANTSSLITNNNQLTTDICNYKNSKSRRLEYSLRCLKYGRSNPSQDSAFGSLTDGELSIASSSFRLSSFQSITSPIDEGVEDVIISISATESDSTVVPETISEASEAAEATTTTTTATAAMTTSNTIGTTAIAAANNLNEASNNVLEPNNKASIQIDSALSTPCRGSSPSHFSNSINDDDFKRSHFSLSLSPKRQYSESTSPNNFQFDPPKILVNDQNSIYTTSPSKRSNTIEVFSQKYRVSSFEDMSPRKKNLRNVNRTAFRSLEEERRIDSAFIPITKRTNSENRVYANNSEKYKKLTHTSFSHRINSNNGSHLNLKAITNGASGSGNGSGAVGGGHGSSHSGGSKSNNNGGIRDRHSMWKDSIFYRKIKIAKSNDSLLESPYYNARLSPSPPSSAPYTTKDNYELRNMFLNRGSSVNEITLSSPGYGCNNTKNNCSNYNSGNTTCSNNKNNFGCLNNKRGNSEDLSMIKTATDNFLQIDSRKSRSERYLFSLSKLKQTAINDCYSSDNDEISLRDNNKKIFSCSSSNAINQISNISINCNSSITKNLLDIPSNSNSKIANKIEEMNHSNEHENDDNYESSEESSPLHQDVCKIIGGMDDTQSNSEEKTPLLDSMEMSPIVSPTNPDPPEL